jgi:hypothetical protein
MISTKDIKESAYINFGTGEYKINSFEIQTASTGSIRIRMNMETRPVTTQGFEGVEGALGKVGRVNLTSYMNPNKDSYKKAINIFQRKISEIADALGVRDEVNAIEASSVEEYINKVSPLLVNKYTNWLLAAEEYLTTDKEGEEVVRTFLLTPMFGFVSSDATKLVFDKNNAYHYKKVEAVENVTSDDLKESKDSTSW